MALRSPVGNVVQEAVIDPLDVAAAAAISLAMLGAAEVTLASCAGRSSSSEPASPTA